MNARAVADPIKPSEDAPNQDDIRAAVEITKILRLALTGDEMDWLTMKLAVHRNVGRGEGIDGLSEALGLTGGTA